MKRLETRSPFLAIPLTLALAASIAVAAAADEAALNSRWRGAWVVVGADVFSDCGGLFTNNHVRGKTARSKGAHRFRAGELGTVHKIDLKRKQVDVLIELAEPLRVTRREGPFTLYDQLPCRVELQIPVPRGGRSTDAVDRLIAGLLEPHESRAAAEASERWNGRLREPFPEDYDDTLYEYELWRARQVNAEVARRIDEAIDEAGRLIDRLDDEPDYLAGFARGIERARDRDLGRDCDRLLSKSLYSFVDRPSKDESRDWREGYVDGQELVFFVETARRLRNCFVPEPR